jgi:hypothetical protein
MSLNSAGAPQIPPSNAGQPACLGDPLASRRESTVAELYEFVSFMLETWRPQAANRKY